MLKFFARAMSPATKEKVNMMWLTEFYDVSRRSSNWTPRYDYSCQDGNNHLTVEMPGVARENLKVNVNGRTLTIEAKRNLGRGEQKWEGRWVLNPKIDAEKIAAKLDSGILSLSLPVTYDSSKGREITVD